MKKIISTVLAVLVVSSVLLFSGCIEGDASSNPVNQKQSLKISGSTTVLPIIKDCVINYDDKNVLIDVSGGGSGFGISEVGNKIVNIGMSSRDIKSSEFTDYPDLKAHTIAKDGVAVVINPENTAVNSITKQQLKDIYAGKITNWKQLGGNDATINVYTRDEESGTREVFDKKGLDGQEIFPKSIVVASNAAMKSSVKSDKYGIGYVSIGYIDNTVKTLNFEGVEPTKENVIMEKYEISRSLYLITSGEPTEVESNFINFVKSPAGQEIVSNKGYIALA
ncbi:phosphate transport system substrate-binding protein [Methanococcus voltae]|uniref:phosphate ABC transporter substrate-binding protein n=1 Tax=Methanococcus voltae TaxID=2188 RepID=UPI001AE1796B|nr:phosphate ABC transporter substrate-binding protein [Methanococcus voltae]MBP2144441.1 phosphate transport system substrate-binding protein [Methanococcus voltae]